MYAVSMHPKFGNSTSNCLTIYKGQTDKLFSIINVDFSVSTVSKIKNCCFWICEIFWNEKIEWIK